MKRIGKRSVRLDDGTIWSVDHAEDDEHSLEWILRYGSTEQVEKHRLMIASVLSSYTALLYQPQKRRNQIVRDIRRVLNESEGAK